MQLHHFRGMHSFDAVCSVLPINIQMHTCAFNTLMANNYVLIHLHSVCFFFSGVVVVCFGLFDSLCVLASFFCVLCFVLLVVSCVMKQWDVYVRNECVLTSGAFDVNAHDQY